MAFTVQQVLDQVNQDLDGDTGDALFSAAAKLAAVNAAIQASWPHIRDVRRDSSLTLDTNTFTYSPTAGDTTTATYASIEYGFGHAYVAPLSSVDSAPIRLRSGVRQILNGTTWTIVVEPGIAREFNGKALYLDYDSRVARISATSDSVELPMDYLQNYTLYRLFLLAIRNDPKFNTDAYKDLLPELRNAWQGALTANRRGLPERLPLGYNHGGATQVPEPLSQVNSVRL